MEMIRGRTYLADWPTVAPVIASIFRHHFHYRCTDKALADYQSADNWCQTISLLSADCRLIQKTNFAVLLMLFI